MTSKIWLGAQPEVYMTLEQTNKKSIATVCGGDPHEAHLWETNERTEREGDTKWQ